MKPKLMIAGLLAAALMTAPSIAQQPQSRSFLNVQSLVATNTLNPTNLLTTGSVGTNIVGLIFTNQNTRTIVSATAGTRQNPFKDVALWSRSDGHPAYDVSVTNLLYQQSDATLSVTWTTGSAADTAIPFVITPLYNGTNEATASGEQWTFSFTPTVSSTETLVTNVPLYRWPGAAKLRLRRVANPDTGADSAVTIRDISINGFVP